MPELQGDDRAGPRRRSTRLARRRDPRGLTALSADERTRACWPSSPASEHAFPPILIAAHVRRLLPAPARPRALGLEPRPPHPKGYEMDAERSVAARSGAPARQDVSASAEPGAARAGAVVERPIVGFATDAAGDWVAWLSCGHPQHVRHTPPFMERPWVLTAEGRAGRLGQVLDCVRCDAAELPPHFVPYKRTAEFTETSLPDALRRRHTTKSRRLGDDPRQRGAAPLLRRRHRRRVRAVAGRRRHRRAGGRAPRRAARPGALRGRVYRAPERRISPMVSSV